MNYKVCTKCNTNLPATTEFFHVQKRGLYNLKSHCKECNTKYNKSRWITVPKKTEKTCGHCKVTFPLTAEYFYTKTTKKGTVKNGYILLNDSVSFRHVCKKCNGLMTTQREDKKLMVKYAVSTEEELKIIKKNNKIAAGKKNLKYTYPESISKQDEWRYRKIFAKGYSIETYQEEWRKKWWENTKAKRKYDYGTEYENKKVPNSLVTKKAVENLTNAIVANRLGFNVSEVPQDIIELKRKQLKFYRYVKKRKENR